MTDEKKKEPPPPIVWPAIGSKWTDSIGRVFVVEKIQPGDGLRRNIIGKVDGVDFATSMEIFEVVWKFSAT